jgi:hypothetical protein
MGLAPTMQKRNFLSVVFVIVWMIGGVSLSYLWISSMRWEYSVYITVFAIVLVLIRIQFGKYPRCREDVFLYPAEWTGREHGIYHLFAPDHCPHCGCSLVED